MKNAHSSGCLFYALRVRSHYNSYHYDANNFSGSDEHWLGAVTANFERALDMTVEAKTRGSQFDAIA
jgi:hypothetical protein